MMSMPPEVPQAPDVLGSFYGRTSRRVAPASRVSRRTREREIRGYQAAFPQTSREQARRATARMRQRGQVPTYTRQPTPQQAEQAERFRQRSERSRESARRGRIGIGGGFQNPILVFTYEYGPGVGWAYNLSRADRSLVGRYWNAVKFYLEIGMVYGVTMPNGRTFLGIRDFDNMPIASGTLHLVGDPDLIDNLAVSGELDFNNIYPQITNPVASAA